MSAHPARAVRSRAYRLYTRLPVAARRAAEGTPPGRLGLGIAQRLIDTGAVTVAGGQARGLLIDPTTLPLTHIQAYGVTRGTAEPEVQEALRRLVGPGATVWDVGANIGFFSLLSAALTGPEGRVLSFEPSPPALAGLRRNVTLNDLDARVQIHGTAVAATPGRAELLQVGQHSWSHLADRGWHPETTAVVEVDVTTVDAEIAAGAPAPDVVKIDVEGSEMRCWRGCAPRSRPTVRHS